MAKRPIDYFRMFYADTALSGSRAGIQCGLEFFGEDRVMFATDCPFDPEGGPMYVRTTPEAIDALAITEKARNKIYFGNALRLLKMEGG
jgi:predicted TIM-barrel fold metal-dependent hydrolase